MKRNESNEIDTEEFRKQGFLVSEQEKTRVMTEFDVNRLLYWGDELKLLDYIEDPLPTNDDQTELIRNITCTIHLGKLVKRFHDSRGTLTEGFRNALIRARMAPKYNQERKEEVVEDLQDCLIKRVTETYYRSELKEGMKEVPGTLMELYQLYLDAPLKASHLSKESQTFRFTPKGTEYEISGLLEGKIKRIKVNHPDGRAPTVEEIIEMSHWANRELADIVEKAAICKTIEETYEPDTESEVSESCEL